MGPEAFSPHSDKKKLCIPHSHSAPDRLVSILQQGFQVNASRSGRASTGEAEEGATLGMPIWKLTAWLQILAQVHKNPVLLGR